MTTEMERVLALRHDRSLLIDGVQLARLRHDLTRKKYVEGRVTSAEFLNTRDQLAEAEAAFRAHVEVYGELK